MIAATVVMAFLSAVPKLTAEEALQLQRVRNNVGQRVGILCGDGSCVYWDTRLRIWRFTRRGVLTDALFEDDRHDPSGISWTDGSLASTFPEFEPKQIALNAMRGPASVIWTALLKWLAEDPRRLDGYGKPLWEAFVSAHLEDPSVPQLKTRSAFGHPYSFEDLEYLGMTADALRIGITILRCEKLLDKAIEQQMRGEEISTDLVQRWMAKGELAEEWGVDAWGTLFRLHHLGEGGGRARMGRSGPYYAGSWLKGWHFRSAGPDRDHRTDDDVGCGDVLRLEGPPKTSRYGPPLPRGKFDDQIDAALIGRAREGSQLGGRKPIGTPIPRPDDLQ